jgi:non-ribosomal peptide synthetase component F
LPSFTGAVTPVRVPAEVTAAMRDLARDSSCSVSSVALAAYHAVLARQAGVTDIVVGTTMAGRVHAGVENLIGFFVNTVPIRGELAGDPPFGEFARQIHESAVAAQEHQELPFERLVEELAPSRDLAQLPLAQVLFNVVSGLNYAALSLPGTEVTDFSEPARTARFELELHLLDNGSNLTGELIYATDLFGQPTAQRFARHYLSFLCAACRDPSQRISLVPRSSGEDDERRNRI